MNPDLQSILAEQLRDIAIPSAVEWWPLAMGWWIVITLTVIALGSLIFWLIRRHRRNRYRVIALEQFQFAIQAWRDNPEPELYLKRSNQTLKRVFVSLGEQNIAAEFGPQWIKSLMARSQHPLSQSTVEALTFECYKPKPRVAIEQLHEELTLWVRSHRGRANV
jgi:hypothetical protein